MTNPTKSDYRDKLAAEVRAAEAEVERLREAKAETKEAASRDVSEEERVARKQVSAALNKARERLEEARLVLERFDKSGQEHAIVVQGNRAVGSIAVHVPPGTSHETRGQLVDETLADPLAKAAEELGVVLAAAPSRYVRERSGRDAEGRTVLDVEGVVEGDVLVPAVNRARKTGRRGR
jgi:serine/threonine protein kinase HipA of HipAB toxin-antitoxin module